MSSLRVIKTIEDKRITDNVEENALMLMTWNRADLSINFKHDSILPLLTPRHFTLNS